LPCDQSLEVKVGERVMFVKNDTSGAKRYYNGMLGTVTGFIEGERLKVNGENADAGLSPLIEVINDDGDTIAVGRETWESLKYSLDEKTNEITQEVEGTFSQYPLQAAWAVTIHKAQGLTFDRVVIDAADAFAFGQVYVALSRCRTLEGLTLSTPLSAGVAFDDAAVHRFVDSQPTFEQTADAASRYEQQYRIEKLMELFSIDLHDAERLQERYDKLKNLYPDHVERLRQLTHSLADLQGVSERFRVQLMQLDEAAQNERALKGAAYYRSQLQAARHAYDALLDVEIDNKEVAKGVREAGEQLTESLGLKLACLEAVEKHGYSVATVQKAKAEYLIEETKEKRKGKKRKEAQETQACPDLVELLRRWRAAKAKEENVKAFHVLQQKALLAIAAAKPRDPKELASLYGIGDKTVEKYGKELLDLVADFRESGQ
ncbi:MAG: HRDC domain-containing protein, partial [Bacteroidales bacterium]|nr:HRDC domain-containing protein [Bacteroidales bacterium]